jgi:RNA polymerase sigma-70 factor (ECF subfamily)
MVMARGRTAGDEVPAAAGAVSPLGDLESLYRQSYVALVRSLSVVAGDQRVAEEAVQEAFIQAHLRWSRLATYDDPVAWLRRVATNRVLNEHRTRRRHLVAVERIGLRSGTDPESAAVDQAGLERAIAGLPIRQRAAVVLRYLGDLTTAEVADAMGITEGAVRYHLHAARQALAVHLRDTDD